MPKDDPQVARLLASRKDVFPDYHQHEFERCFRQYFDIEASEPIPDSGRVLYLMRGRGARPRRRWVLHPFLIAVFPILSLYSHNVYETSPRSLVAADRPGAGRDARHLAGVCGG